MDELIEYDNLNYHKINEKRIIKTGIPKNLFISSENILKNFICPICNLIVYEPTKYCEKCGVLICKKCINYSLQCPKCKDYTLERVYPRILKNVLNNLTLNCVFKENGCNKICSYENFSKHIFDCEYGKFKCNNCKFIGNLFEIENHSKNCKYNKIKCKYCGKEILKNEKIIHDKQCNNQFTNCKRCGYEICNRDYEEHKKNCNYIFYDCEFCGRNYILKDYNFHNCIGYLKKLKKYKLTRIAYMKIKIENVEKQIKALKKKRKRLNLNK